MDGSQLPLGGITGRAPYRRWTDDEIRLFREHYPRTGMAVLAEAMPDRSTVSIYAQARRLGLRAPEQVQRLRKRHKATPELDARITAFYSRPIEPGALPRFARSIGMPHWWVKLRAATLGVTFSRLRPEPWTDDAIDLLTEHAAKSPETIRKILLRHGIRRTLSSIANKRKKLGLRLDDERELAGLWNLRRVAQALGVSDRAVQRWIRMDRLRATRRPHVESEEWEVRLPDLRRFCAENPEEIDLRTVDREDFLWIAFGDCHRRTA